MSKVQKSESRSRSRSAPRSRSVSRSRSRTKSSSRSRSRKRRYSSRSRSRSRSLSPIHNRERNHTREYQSQRGFRGNRGFRRPYYFRGRGQGYFRGRFQRGGRGGYNNYRPNNWQNFRPQPQQQQQPYHRKSSPKRGRSHSRSPKKESKSPQNRSHSRRSDRSSSGKSPLSHHSSSSGSVKRLRKDAREDTSVPKESHCTRAGDGNVEVQVGGSLLAEGSESLNSQAVMDLDASPKRMSPQVGSSVTDDQLIDLVTNDAGLGQKCSPSNKSPLKKMLLNGLGVFSNLDHQTEETVAISAAFLKFLEEQKLKNQYTSWVNSTHNEIGGSLCDKENGGICEKSSNIELCTQDKAKEKEKCRSVRSGESHVSIMSGSKRSPLSVPLFMCEDEEEDKEIEVPCRKKDADDNTSKSKTMLSAQKMFEERIKNLQDMAWDDELESLLTCHKQERAANILASLSKRDQLSGSMFKDSSPESCSNVKRKQKLTTGSSSKASHQTRRSSESHEQEMFVVMNEESPPRALTKGGSEFSTRMDCFSEDTPRSTVLTNDRKNLLDFLQLDKKGWDLYSVLQHLRSQQTPCSPSDLFAQHIVSIVHQIKAQCFPSSGLTLHDRFAMYQRRAAEKEFIKQRKSPEIHRRIDVSPSAFKRQSLLFDEMKSSVENSFKVEGKKTKNDSLDLRLDIERRKKCMLGERERGEQDFAVKVSKESPGASKDSATDKESDVHKKLKKNIRKWEHSESCSSSSASSVCNDDEAEIKTHGFSRARLGFRGYGQSLERGHVQGGFPRIRSRGWNRGNCHGNGDSQQNSSTKNEVWDPEFSPKAKKLFLRNDVDGEGERKLMEAQGRGRGNVLRAKGRFILRRAANTAKNNASPKWEHDKFQASDDESEQQGADGEQTNWKSSGASTKK